MFETTYFNGAIRTCSAYQCISRKANTHLYSRKRIILYSRHLETTTQHNLFSVFSSCPACSAARRHYVQFSVTENALSGKSQTGQLPLLWVPDLARQTPTGMAMTYYPRIALAWHTLTACLALCLSAERWLIVEREHRLLMLVKQELGPEICTPYYELHPAVSQQSAQAHPIC